MKLIMVLFKSKKLVIHLIDDCHVLNVLINQLIKLVKYQLIKYATIHMASSHLAIAVAHPVDGAMIFFQQE